MKKFIFLAIIGAITIVACKTKKETVKTEAATPKPAMDCSSKGLTYAAIKPIFEKHCTSCHGYGGAGGLNFESLADIKRAAGNGELMGTIKWQRGFPKMPARAEQLDQATIETIECWINNGMKE